MDGVIENAQLLLAINGHTGPAWSITARRVTYTNTPGMLVLLVEHAHDKLDFPATFPPAKKAACKEVSLECGNLAEIMENEKENCVHRINSDLSQGACGKTSDLNQDASEAKSDLNQDAYEAKSDLNQDACVEKSDLNQDAYEAKSDLNQDASEAKNDLNQDACAKNDLHQDACAGVRRGKRTLVRITKKCVPASSSSARPSTKGYVAKSKVQPGPDTRKRPRVMEVLNMQLPPIHQAVVHPGLTNVQELKELFQDPENELYLKNRLFVLTDKMKKRWHKRWLVDRSLRYSLMCTLFMNHQFLALEKPFKSAAHLLGDIYDHWTKHKISPVNLGSRIGLPPEWNDEVVLPALNEATSREHFTCRDTPGNIANLREVLQEIEGEAVTLAANLIAAGDVSGAVKELTKLQQFDEFAILRAFGIVCVLCVAGRHQIDASFYVFNCESTNELIAKHCNGNADLLSDLATSLGTTVFLLQRFYFISRCDESPLE